MSNIAAPAARPRRRLKRVLAFAAIAGPGLIAANAGNDAGGVLTYASAGAQFAYRTLFVMVIVTVALVVVQEMCARLGAYTGEGLGALIREQFSLRASAGAMALLFIANCGLTVSEFAGIGAAMELLGVSRYIAIPVALVGLWALTVFGDYSKGEKVALVLSLAFIVYPAAAILAHPNAHVVARDLLTPQFVHSTAFLVLVVALIGTTITPYMQFYVASAVVDKKIGPEQYPAERVDTVNGAILSDIVSIFIIIATAAAVGGTGPLVSAREAALALVPAVGSAAPALFGVGLLGASLLAAVVVPLSSSYAIAEGIGGERSVSDSFRRAPVFFGLFTVQLVVGAVVALAPGNLISLVVNMQLLNGVITPVLLTFVLILANRRSVLGDAANGRVFKVIATICVATVGVLAFAVLMLKLLGKA
ncbi:MAG TPA: NRAMP family divalent metal transporter [Gaiellaceae bacterium]|nr:NRAMP family divalent metal transporter [Gaiellaceae bacterium]